MSNSTSFLFLLLASITFSFSGCSKSSSSSGNINLTQLGTGDFKPGTGGIMGFNNKGLPIVHHPNNFLYEWDETNNSFKKIGNEIPNAVTVFSGSIAQDALGVYYYHSGSQGHIFKLNTTTNSWDTATIVPGYKNQMLSNAKGDILVYINNTPIGGFESFYKKAANSSTWVKVLDMPANNQNQLIPQFLSNDGLAFFSVSSTVSNGVDGEGIYSDQVLNTNTAKFDKLFDKSDPDNFTVLKAYNYTAFNAFYISPDGNFYAMEPASSGPKTYLYKLSTKTLPGKFVKLNEFNHPPLETGSYITMRGCKVNESTGQIKFRSSCQFGSYSHKNLGHGAIGDSELEMLQHDGPQNSIYASPTGTVYVLNYEGFLYKWN